MAWFWFLVALVASLGANIATAGLLDLENVPAWLRILVAGWPALAFLGGTLLAHQPNVPEPRSASEPEPASPVVAVDRPAPPDPKAGPEVNAPEPPPALPEAAPAVTVPPALVDHARKVATEHRTRTGTEIDTATLRVRLGVPEELAGAIVAQLA